MDLTSWALFSLAFAMAVLSPGPAQAAILASTINGTRSATAALIAGLIMGDMVWLGVALTGLEVLARGGDPLLIGLRIMASAYLSWMALGLWRAQPQAHLDREDTPLATAGSAFSRGLMVNISNPKAALFYLALLPTLVSLANLDALGYAGLVLVMALILLSIFSMVAFLASQARRFLTEPKHVQRLNRCTAGFLGAAAVALWWP